MSDLKISQLPSLPLPISASDVIPIVRDSNVVTNKITYENLTASLTGSVADAVTGSIINTVLSTTTLQSVVTNNSFATGSNIVISNNDGGVTAYGQLNITPLEVSFVNRTVDGSQLSKLWLLINNAQLQSTSDVTLAAPNLYITTDTITPGNTATPAGYMKVILNGTAVGIPYYI